jgi:hypothetical protein
MAEGKLETQVRARSEEGAMCMVTSDHGRKYAFLVADLIEFFQGFVLPPVFEACSNERIELDEEDLPQLPPGSAGTFVLTMFAAVAELERGLNSERTKAALRAAKERGVKLGTRSLVRGFDTAMTRAGRAARTQRASKHAENVLPFILAAQKAGANSLREVAAALTARGIQPPRGDCWHPQMVQRILGPAPLSPRLVRLRGRGSAVVPDRRDM